MMRVTTVRKMRRRKLSVEMLCPSSKKRLAKYV